MPSKEQELPNIPPASANRNAHRDTEATTIASHDAREKRRKKRRKWLLYVVLFIIFQSAVIAVFTLTIMKIRRPKFSVGAATFSNFNVDNSTAKPSFSTRMNVELRVKNSNFGRFQYKATTVYFSYRATSIGEALVSESHAKWKSKKKFVVDVDLDFAGAQSDPQLVSDLADGVVPISSHAELRGKVELLFVLKKRKSTYINCSMEILTGSQQLGNIAC
ncbi:late embryogenesis abundant protein At1g64065-like [Primulina eburnea]|uniref:late embryogenesis abundant protein At1g64065-like n=1 Tax=Primulina eburnea TaxID=1245227 RepID=UPI003C6C9DE3